MRTFNSQGQFLNWFAELPESEQLDPDNQNPNIDSDAKFLLIDGSVSMTGNLNMSSNNIVSVGTVDGRDISADGSQLNTNTSNISTNTTNIANKFNTDGSTNFGGTLNMGGNAITNVGNVDGVDVSAIVSADGSVNTHSDIDGSGASTDDVLAWDGGSWVATTLTTPTQEIYEVFGSTGTQTLTTTAVIANLNSQVAAATNFSNSAGSVTYTGTTKTFIVNFKSTGNSTGQRSIMRSSIYINGTELARSRSYSYHRNSTDGEDSGTSSNLITLNNGDVITLRVREESTGDTIVFQRQYSNMVFVEVL